jgi:hypothetical protein
MLLWHQTGSRDQLRPNIKQVRGKDVPKHSTMLETGLYQELHRKLVVELVEKLRIVELTIEKLDICTYYSPTPPKG